MKGVFAVKKRILALLLCALLVLGGLPTMAKQPESSDVSQRFFDVKKTDWFYKNEKFDREIDERADRNKYRLM